MGADDVPVDAEGDVGVAERLAAAALATQEGRFGDARGTLTAVAADPSASRAEVARAQFAVAMLGVASAETFADRNVELVAARAALGRMPETDPATAAMRDMLEAADPGVLAAAAAAFDAGDDTAAVAPLLAALEDLSITGALRTLVVVTVAELLFASGRHAEVLEVAERLDSSDPATWPVWHLVVSSAVALGRLSVAEEVARQLAAASEPVDDVRRFVYAALAAEVAAAADDVSAVDALLEVAAALDGQADADHPFVAHLSDTIVETSLRLGRPEVAVGILSERYEEVAESSPDGVPVAVVDAFAAALSASGDPQAASEVLSRHWPAVVAAIAASDPSGISAALTHIAAQASVAPSEAAAEAVALFRWLSERRVWDDTDVEIVRQVAVETLVAAGRAGDAFDICVQVVDAWLMLGCPDAQTWWLGVLADVVASKPATTLAFLLDVLDRSAPAAAHTAAQHASAVAVGLLAAAGAVSEARALARSRFELVAAVADDLQRVAVARRSAARQLAGLGDPAAASALLEACTDVAAPDLAVVALDLPVWAAATAASGDVGRVEAVRAAWAAVVGPGGARADDPGAAGLGRLVASALTGAGPMSPDDPAGPESEPTVS